MIRIFIFFIPLLISLGVSPTGPALDRPISQEPIISFGLVTDIQYCECEPIGSRYYSRSLQKLRSAVEDFNTHDLDFVINLGDMIDRDYNSFAPVKQILDSASAPVYNVLGNHEFDIDPKLRKRVAGELGTGKGYYSFEIEAFRFVILNSNDVSLYSPDRRSRKEAEEMILAIDSLATLEKYYYDGGIGKVQMAWFRTELETAASKGQKVLIFSHHPAWPPETLNILNYKEVIEMMSGFNNVIAWFCGHNHQGNYGNTNLVHFVNMRGMVETEDKNSYAVVEIYGNRLWIKARGREKSQILAY